MNKATNKSVLWDFLSLAKNGDCETHIAAKKRYCENRVTTMVFEGLVRHPCDWVTTLKYWSSLSFALHFSLRSFWQSLSHKSVCENAMGIIGSDSLALLNRSSRCFGMNTRVGTDCGFYHFETHWASMKHMQQPLSAKPFDIIKYACTLFLDNLSENSSILVLRFWVPIKALPQYPS